MRRTLSARVAIAAGSSAVLAIAFAAPSVANAAETGGRHVLNGKPAWAAQAARVGAVPASTGLNFKVVLNLRDEAGAEALATAVATPGNANYHKYVTAAQWRSRFAPTDAQVAQVTSWLKSQGLKIGQIPANHRYVTVSGSTAQVNKAFGASMSHFKYKGRTETAPSAALSVPTNIAGLVAGVSGLDSTLRAVPSTSTGNTTHSVSTDKATASTKVTSDDTLPGPPDVFINSGPCSSYYGEKKATGLPTLPGVTNPMPYVVCGYKPGQIRSAYGEDRLLKAGYDGRGATVAIIDAFASPTILSDAQTYAQRNDPSHPLRGYQFSQSLPASYNSIDECGGNGWYGEETLDVEAVHATAPQANILYVGGASCYDSDLNSALNTVVDNQLAMVVSNSYGDAGEPTSLADVADSHQSAIQAAAEGISLLFSSGDNGDEVADLGYRTVDYEASDPFVTAVGGTSLAVKSDGSYGWEQGWGTGKSTLTNGAWTPAAPAYVYGGGGGTSQLFTQPAYQKGVVPASISNYFGKGDYRAVPDVAMDADPQTGFLVGETQAFPDGSTKYSEYRIGGTSLSSPLFAGEVALADQVVGGPLGFLNPAMYKLAGTPTFNDIASTGVSQAEVRVDFVNGVDASGGLRTTARTINQTGTIFTRKGYDDVTGVGTPNGVSFFIGITASKKLGVGGGGVGGGIKHGAPVTAAKPLR
ncbi:pro-kumamolisin-like protein [Branchiibius hedensis]|uniref:Pro-kumamolisin, activation domain n=1 Tax=Branchiibius hedensis TaxID=672460 RepID=A0A2Y8ZLV5_9MICO|nr:S53 family peptidase [Branchiibius hedensis]PWJ24157.1 pro-kumamolisin-like protein [Branchiibius hedensis]SSA32975.1 Pro-kumamolisin, activation domain [Branchiibius hedensis]